MRILALSNLYPNPFQPQRATFNRHQFRLLGQKHSVRVIAPIAWTDEWKAKRAGKPSLPASRQVTLDGLTVDHPRHLFPPKIGRGWYGHFFQASVTKTFRRVVAEFRPELVFATWAYPDGWAAVRLGHAAGLPVVLKCHGSDVLLLDQNPSRRQGTKAAVTGADGLVAVSSDLRDHLVTLGAKPSDILVNIGGVDHEQFHPGPKAQARAAVGLGDGPPVILFIGNLVSVKAVDVLLTACGQLTRDGFALRVVIVGDGQLRSKLEIQATELGIREKVQFMGSLPQDSLPNWYRAADLFVLPSHSEGVPNVLLEASACGTPWVASRVGGIPEIASQGVSKLVAPNAADELATAIRESLLAPPQPLPNRPKTREQSVNELEAFLSERVLTFNARRSR